MKFSWLTERGKMLILLLVISLIVKLICFTVGVTDNKAFDLEHWEDLFALGEIEPFRDYGLQYLPTIEAFKSGYTPYFDFWYAYPPLFLYVLTAFSYLPFDFWGPALAFLVSDVFSVVLVYLISLRFLSEKKSFLASLLYMLAPINLFYNDYLWLNPPLVTLPSLLATYFLLTERYRLSSLTLGIAFGFKQTGLVLFPISSILVYKKAGSMKALSFIALFIVTVIAISMPYLVTASSYYIWCLSSQRILIGYIRPLGEEYWNRCFWPWTLTANITMPEAYTTYPIRGNSPVNLAVPIFVFTSQGMEGDRLFKYFGDFGKVASPILDLALFASFSLLLLSLSRSKEVSSRDVVRYLFFSLVLFYSFYDRGIYKYYFATVTPFLAPLVHSRIRRTLFILFNFLTLIVPRYLSPWILFPFLVYTVLKFVKGRIL